MKEKINERDWNVRLVSLFINPNIFRLIKKLRFVDHKTTPKKPPPGGIIQKLKLRHQSIHIT